MPGPSESAAEKLRIAGVVLKWIRGDKEANFQRIGPMIRRAAAGGALLVLTKEIGSAVDQKQVF